MHSQKPLSHIVVLSLFVACSSTSNNQHEKFGAFPGDLRNPLRLSLSVDESANLGIGPMISVSLSNLSQKPLRLIAPQIPAIGAPLYAATSFEGHIVNSIEFVTDPKTIAPPTQLVGSQEKPSGLNLLPNTRFIVKRARWPNMALPRLGRFKIFARLNVVASNGMNYNLTSNSVVCDVGGNSSPTSACVVECIQTRERDMQVIVSPGSDGGLKVGEVFVFGHPLAGNETKIAITKLEPKRAFARITQGKLPVAGDRASFHLQ